MLFRSGTAYTMTATNSSGGSGAEGVLTFRVNAGAATDIYGNTNSASSTFTNNWTATITYNSNVGGTAPANSIQSTSIASVSLPGIGTMAKTGYSFSGWATTSTGTTSVGATYTPTSNTTLYAIWTPAVYVVTYNANGGVGLPSRSTDSYTYGTTALTLQSNGGTTALTLDTSQNATFAGSVKIGRAHV